MNVYVTVYRGKKMVECINSENLKEYTSNSVCRWSPKVGFYGEVYNKDSLFINPDAAWKYWNREHVPEHMRFKLS